MVRTAEILAFVGCLAGSRAEADPQLSPVTNRNYSIELYDGAALGNTAVVGMGGAAVALASGSSGTLTTPAAPAVRSTTDTDKWNWDYHIDYLIGSLSNDFDNNGILPKDTSRTGFGTAGLGLRVHDWAGAVTFTDQFAPVDGTSGSVNLRASTQRWRFAFAKWVPQLDTAIGVSGQSAQFDLRPDCAGPGCGSLFNISGGGVEAGATWLPRRQSFRIGVSGASPIAGGTVVTTCDPNNCNGFILPEKVVSPWRLAGGFAYRWAETVWNQQVGGWFRDERALTVAADVVIVGSSANAYGLEAFGMHELQRSGMHPAFSVRAGAEYEWVPGRFRVRGGSYWEPGRFEGVSGRIHATAGIEVRVFHFRFFGPRRGRISLTGDVASQYRNVGLSVGFWH